MIISSAPSKDHAPHRLPGSGQAHKHIGGVAIMIRDVVDSGIELHEEIPNDHNNMQHPSMQRGFVHIG